MFHMSNDSRLFKDAPGPGLLPLYEAKLFVRGKVKSLGADCVEKEMRDEHKAMLRKLLDVAGAKADASEFRRYGSARKLYHFHVDNAGQY